MNILVLGGGGREHALCWALKRSPQTKDLYCAPGNAGIAAVATCVSDINPCEAAQVLAFSQEHHIDLVVIGPEAPLVAGVSDALRQAGVAVFGPSQAAATLEGSKGFMKDLCQANGIPTAAYKRCATLAEATAFIQTLPTPVVVKADGLAAGKGVIIAESHADAIEAARTMLEDGQFGTAGTSLVIEEFLDGEEVSFFALCDGRTTLPLATAQDHKRAFDGDKGPNTGGMGAYSPARMESPAFIDDIMRTIIQPTADAMAAAGTPYQGVLYAGLMLTSDGPKLLEYNVRFGDPECQVLMPRLQSDCAALLWHTARQSLDQVPPLAWSSDTALTVVMASQGYPGSYEKGSVISGLEQATNDNTHLIFHAGTSPGPAGEILATGGRVLAVTGLGPTLAEAQKQAYAGVSGIDWPQGFYRRDIGAKAL